MDSKHEHSLIHPILSNLGSKAKRTKDQAKTKVVIRRLPPSLPKEIFTKSISQWIETTDFYYFVSGKTAKTYTPTGKDGHELPECSLLSRTVELPRKASIQEHIYTSKMHKPCWSFIIALKVMCLWMQKVQRIATRSFFALEENLRRRLCMIGNETRVHIEFAPSQQIPKRKSKPDARMATIYEGRRVLSNQAFGLVCSET